jgi:hypothetical protein
MATAKVKETPEVETPVEETVSVDDPGFVEAVTSVVRDFLSKTKDAPAETEVETETGKRPTARDEEERVTNLVSAAIAKFKSEAETTEPETGKVAEKVPGSVSFRKIEKWLWGVE